MAELTSKLFRDYFGGSWIGKISKNGQYQRKVAFNWSKAFDKYSAIGIEEGCISPAGGGTFSNTHQVSISGWKNDIKRWCRTWHNEFGGYGELQWTSQELVDGKTILYGFVHECKQETDSPTDHIVKCELIDENNFKYTLSSFRKGITEVIFKRIRTSKELKKFTKDQAQDIKSFSDILNTN